MPGTAVIPPRMSKPVAPAPSPCGEPDPATTPMLPATTARTADAPTKVRAWAAGRASAKPRARIMAAAAPSVQTTRVAGWADVIRAGSSRIGTAVATANGIARSRSRP